MTEKDLYLEALESLATERLRQKKGELWSLEHKRFQTPVSLWDSIIDQTKGEISELRWLLKHLAK